MDQYSLDREAFKAWLADNYSSIVGRACAACDCPIVNFAKGNDTRLPRTVSSGGGSITLDGIDQELPAWARLFILELDASLNYHATVTGQYGLSILEKLDA